MVGSGCGVEMAYIFLATRLDRKSPLLEAKKLGGSKKEPKCQLPTSFRCGSSCQPKRNESGKPRKCNHQLSPEAQQKVQKLLQLHEQDTGKVQLRPQAGQSGGASIKADPNRQQPKPEPEQPTPPTPKPKQRIPKDAHKSYIDRGDKVMPDSLKKAAERLDQEQTLLKRTEAKMRSLRPAIQKGDRKAIELGRKLSAERKRLLASDANKQLEAEMSKFHKQLFSGTPEQRQAAVSFAKSVTVDSGARRASGEAKDLYEEASGERKKRMDEAGLIKSEVDLRKTVASYHMLVGGKGTETIQKFTKTSDRAFARPTENMVNVGSNPRRKVMLHEMAHHLEANDPRIGEASLAWIASRAEGKAQKLSELTGNPKYGDNEKAVPDKFVNPYIGKIYRDKNGEVKAATEVVSMGVERLNSPKEMMEFYRQDPEHFKFILGILKQDA